MKWFKHHAAMSDDPKVQALEGEFGVQGYAFYSKMLELCTQQYDGTSAEFLFTFNWVTLQNKLRMKRKRIALLIRTSSELKFWTAELTDKVVNIKFPKLLEIRHKDALSSDNRQNPGVPVAGLDKRKRKIKKESKNKERIHSDSDITLFKSFRDLYLKTFEGTTEGPNARARFFEQMKDPTFIEALTRAVPNYRKRLDYDNRDRAWRSPKGTFEAFLGTKSSGYFWQDYKDYKPPAGVSADLSDIPWDKAGGIA